MFCQNCGRKLEENANFCINCGAPVIFVENSSNAPSVSKISITQPKQSGTEKKTKSNPLKWIIPVAVVVPVVVIILLMLISPVSTQEEAERVALDFIDKNYCSTFGDEVDFIEKNEKNHYTIGYNVNRDYDLWKLSGNIKVSVYKDAGEWYVDVKEENIEYSFEKNDNWYYITASSNREYLIKMIAINDKEVTLEYYSYRMGSYGGSDDYDHETTTCELEYDGENRRFAFVFMGDWRINNNYIEYNKYEVGAYYEYYQSGDFKTLQPANPEDYWWYERAKNRDYN